MPLPFRCLILLATVLLGACQALSPILPRQAGERQRPVLLLVSIDGFHPDYLDRGRTPTLQTLADDGARARWMIPSFPSKTFPNHYTLVTGLVPDHHGIIDNAMYDAELGRFTLRDRNAVGDGRWWQGEPVWVTARRAGLRTAVMFWPGSEAEIGGLRPHEWSPYDPDVTAEQRVDRVLEWLRRPAFQRPHLVLTYFEDVDLAGHLYGPDSPQVNRALERVDAALARLMHGLHRHGLEDSVNLVVVSDHGMAALLPGRELFLEDMVDPALVQVVTFGEVTGLQPRPGQEEAVAAALLRPRPGIACHRRGQLPPAWRFGSHPRVPEFVCLLEEGWRLRRREQFGPWQKQMESNLGAHGFDPELPSMRALFIAWGPDFEPGALVEPFANVHVQPLLLRLLGIEGPAGDGDPAVTVSLLRGAPSAAAAVQRAVQP